VWGTTAELQVTDPAVLTWGSRILSEELQAIDAACSRFRDDSELTAVNRSGGRAVSASPVFLRAVAAALRAADLTGGAVDPTCGKALIALGYDRDYAALRAAGSAGTVTLRPVPGWRTVILDVERATVQVPGGVLLDLGATAKALAADRAAERIAASLGCGALVNLGGDVAVAGPAPIDGWPVAVADDHPARVAAPEETVAIRDGGLATSSTAVRTWQRGARTVHHIVDPRTGDSVPPFWVTATASAGTCLDANMLTTAAIVRGEAGLEWLTGLGCPLRLVRHDGVVVRLGGWPEEPPR
jgi:FAD:protein FMN transferase